MRTLCALAAFFTSFVRAESMEPALQPAHAMPLDHAILLGLVEGATEYLPVSSTGHLLLTQRLLGIGASEADKVAADSFAIVIQFGAILAVLSLYRTEIRSLFLGLFGRSKEGRALLVNLVVAFFPAAVVGLLFVDLIKSVLFGLWPVTFAWFLGGVALIAFRSRGAAGAGSALETLRPQQALVIGLIQCVAMWPGTSRSLVTILGGRLVGLSLQSAVVFSFLLGMVTLSAGTAYDLWQNGDEMVRVFGVGSLLAGIVTGWLAAVCAVKWMVAYLQRHGLAIFGFYRIGISVVTAVLLSLKVIHP